MTKYPRLAFLALIAGLATHYSAIAAEAREITWDDLVPAAAQFDDAFTKLDEDTLYELSLVAQIRDRLEAGKKVDEETMANYEKRVKELEEDEVDIDGLIAMRDEVAKERVAKTFLANAGVPVRSEGQSLAQTKVAS